MSTHKKLIEQFKQDGVRFWSGDNVSEYVDEKTKQKLINEATKAFEKVLDTLLIDWQNDPNATGTPRRLAKQYYHELFQGRYNKKPDVTAFPNQGEDAYKGLLVIRAELKSLCSHHHQPVTGVAYIGIIPGEKVIGLSKYARIAQWCARRGTLQEELCNDICKEIQRATESDDVAVYIAARHGCMENRGVMCHSSVTQTTVLKGQFQEHDVKDEFFKQVNLQQQLARD